jgi:hypothetical protein
LDGGGISEAADHATKGIHFMDKLAFGRTANGRIAGLPGDPVEIESKQGCLQPQASSRNGCFTTGMTAPYDDHVEDFGGGSAIDHQFIIPIIWWDSEWLKSLLARLIRDCARLS